MERRENIKLEPFSPKDTKEFEEGIYTQKIKMTDYHKQTLKQEINDIHGVLKTQRGKHEEEWDLCDKIYEGHIDAIEGQQFNVHYGIMAEKIDNAVNRCDMAFFDGERIFDISPRA